MRILITGGTGTFGRAVIPLLTARHNEVLAPSKNDLDVRDGAAWHRVITAFQPETIVHAAAFTGVEKAEGERETCYEINVVGTRLGVEAAAKRNLRFVYISSDYVFDGDKGCYRVNDHLGPRNYYAFTKAAGDLIVSQYDQGAVIRTSFAPDGKWRYPRAWADLWTGKDYISVLAPEYALAVIIGFTGIVHIVTERKTVFELAQRNTPEIQPIRRDEVGFALPKDVSLDTGSWEFVKRCWKRVYRQRS